MKISALVLLALVPAVHASSSVGTPDQDLKNYMISHKAEVEKKTESALLQAVQQSTLKQFQVDWASVVCHAANQSEVSPALVGTCFLNASAFEVSSEIAVTQGIKGITVDVLYADVE